MLVPVTVRAVLGRVHPDGTAEVTLELVSPEGWVYRRDGPCRLHTGDWLAVERGQFEATLSLEGGVCPPVFVRERRTGGEG